MIRAHWSGRRLVMAGLLLSRRGIIKGIEYVDSLAGNPDEEAVNKLVELLIRISLSIGLTPFCFLPTTLSPE